MSTHFQPAAGKHAIEVCTIVLRFVQPLDPQTFEAVRVAASQIAVENDLPAQQQIAFPQIMLGMGMPIPQQTAGVSFQRFAKNGQVEAELRCEQVSIILQVRKYEGWVALSDLIDRTVLKLVPLYVSNVPAISGVTIQYDDKFLGGSPLEAAAAGEMFREATRWVNLHDRATTQPWHSHFGIFLSSAPEHRELVNVNVTVNDQINGSGEQQRTVGLTILVGEMFDVPGQQPLIVEQSSASAAVKELLETAHGRQKLILQEVLTDDYLRAIGASKDGE